MEKIKSEFGKKVRLIRMKNNMTQEELANRAVLHPTYIGQIERGLRNPTLVNLYKIAKALNVNSSEILPF